jgi:septal ring factor EnvC (AmiA/AmiB activator)
MLAFLAMLAALYSQPPETVPPDPDEAARLEEEERQAAESAEAAAVQAAALADEIALLQQQLVSLGRRVSDSEEAALDAERAIARLTAEESEILTRLDADRETLIDVLAAIQRIETQAPPAVLAAPEDAADAARAANLMAEIAPALRERASALMLELDTLRQIRADQLTQRETLSSAETDLSRQRFEIEVLIAERRSLESRRRNEAVEFATAASSAGERARSLRSLLGELQRMAEVMPNISPRRARAIGEVPSPRVRPSRELVAARPLSSPLQTLRFADARGRLRQPAAGEIVRNFGEDDRDGNASEGIFIRTRARAQVISPFDARVEFAGPFNTYGGLLILNVGDDYYVVLAGMAVTFAGAGQSVLAGEPVGAMADQGEPAPELYLELRRGSSAVNPGPWLSSD